MTELATAANPMFSVSRVEIDRPGETYTVDTVRQLRAEHEADAEFFFIIGADALSAGWTPGISPRSCLSWCISSAARGEGTHWLRGRWAKRSSV